jgi:hypothetical protein
VVLRVVVTALSLAVAAHITWAFTGPGTDTARVGAQVTWLDRQLREGAGPRMQDLLPEGDYFTNVLTGLAAVRVAQATTGGSREAHLRTARHALTELAAPRNARLFAGITSPRGGVFFRGWRLLLLTEIARVTGTGAELDEVRRDAAELQKAFATSATGLLESYPGQYWPCDNVVGMAALVHANILLREDDPCSVAAGWLDRTRLLRDRATGLLPHRSGRDGSPEEGPRGSSQSLIQIFLPELAPDEAPAEWTAYRRLFVVREAGLVVVLEFPNGSSGQGDVDSGPLVLGVSLSASAVTLAAARANGDTALADTLDREAETFGVGLQWAGERRYALGQLPVGDAWLGWARSTPVGAGALVSDGPRAWWWAYALLALTPTVLVALWELTARRRRGHRRAAGSAATAAG